jgi:prevent-host-death family protein
MQSVNYSYARNNLKTIMNNVCDYDEEYIITNKDHQDVVVLPLDRYNEIKKDIKISLEEIKNKDFYDIDEAFDKVISKYED